jgi:hypothetical protein
MRDLPAVKLVERALALRPGSKLDPLNAPKIAPPVRLPLATRR